MPLSIGRRIGPYEVVAAIGAGGMGEVYHARDTKLGRDVALKILPDEFAHDPDRLARFAREARLLASLNHPNIAQIYGVEEEHAPGVQAIVMELVTGPTLADLVAGSALTARDSQSGRAPHRASRTLGLPDILLIARQVAGALEAAHEQGIVHRDLKPANIKVRDDGTVKVLDFGLAKGRDAAGGTGSDADSDAATITSPMMTKMGVVLGTAAYVSPEQARGKAVDKRTDTWAFGCVLYEMLTGHRAFTGDTVPDVVAAILERDVDWSRLPASTPAGIRTLLRRCLEKDASKRLRDLGDARLEIDDALAAPASVTPPGLAPIAPRSSRFLALAFAAGALAVAAIGLLAWQFFAGRKALAPRPQLVFTRLTHDPGLQTDASISPDGKSMVYSANKAGNFDLYWQPIGAGDPIQITTDPAHDWQPDFSESGDIVFRSERGNGGLFVVPQSGGHATKISSFGYAPRWSKDGSHVLFRDRQEQEDSSKLYVVTKEGGAAGEIDLPTLSLPGGAFGWNPDGRRVTLLAGQGAPAFSISLITIDPTGTKVLRSTINDAVQAAFKESQLSVSSLQTLSWGPDGRSLYFIGRTQGVANVWMIDVDPTTLAVAGGPFRLTTMAETNSHISISRTAVMVFGAQSGNSVVVSYPLDPSGRHISGTPVPLTASELSVVDPDITSDGRTLVFSVSRPGGATRQELHLQSVGSNDRILFMTDSLRGEFRSQSRISPDGRHVAYRYISPETLTPAGANRLTGPQRIRVADTATGDESFLNSLAEGYDLPGGWSPDGQSVLSAAGGGRYKPARFSIALLPLSAAPAAETRATLLVTSDDHRLFQPSMSAGGRWVVFNVTDQKGGSRIAVASAKGGATERDWKHVTDGTAWEDKPRWSADGGLIYFLSTRGGLSNVWAVDIDPATGAAMGPPFVITSFNGPGEQMPPGLGGMEIGVARGRLVVPTVNPTGGIWKLEHFDR